MHQHQFETKSLPPPWMLRRPKSWLRQVYDFIGAPLRMALLPDHLSEQLKLTSLRAERMGMVLPQLQGRVLDIGAGDNLLIRLYQNDSEALKRDASAVQSSVGVDVVDWGGGCTVIPSSANIPFADASFDTVCFIACLNHISEREAALLEARRLLKQSGRLLITMIGHRLGDLGHSIWWYSEEKHRHVDAEELPGMDPEAVVGLLKKSGFTNIHINPFVYGLNRLYVAHP